MTHGDKDKAKKAASKASGKTSSKAAGAEKGVQTGSKAGGKEGVGAKAAASEKSSASVKAGAKAAAKAPAKTAAKGTNGEGVAKAVPQPPPVAAKGKRPAAPEPAGGFNNPVVGNAFKRAVKKYPNAFRRLTD